MRAVHERVVAAGAGEEPAAAHLCDDEPGAHRVPGAEASVPPRRARATGHSCASRSCATNSRARSDPTRSGWRRARPRSSLSMGASSASSGSMMLNATVIWSGSWRRDATSISHSSQTSTRSGTPGPLRRLWARARSSILSRQYRPQVRLRMQNSKRSFSLFGRRPRTASGLAASRRTIRHGYWASGLKIRGSRNRLRGTVL